ncbi:MAG: CvpA family protein [Bacillota bacterium]|nr:CvpA family protein [Thermoanaerobacteraceae bacterium]
MNWLDVILILLLAGGAFQGLRTGLVLSCIRLAGIGMAFFVAARWYQPLGDFLEQRWHLADFLAAWLVHFWKLPQAFFGLPPEAAQALLPAETLAVSGTPGAAAVPDAGADLVFRLARSIVNAGAFVFLLIVTERLWFFAGRSATFFRRWLLFLPLDRLGGLLFGAAWGVVGGAVVILLLRYVASLGTGLLGPENFLTRALGAAALVPYYEGLVRAAGGFLPGAGVAI